jgi:nitrogen fixation protein NifB
MSHCQQCRADAIGLLGDDRSLEFRCPEGAQETKPESPDKPDQEQYRIAVATGDGRLVDRHFGHTPEFAIYRGDGDVFQLVEKRQVARYCSGKEDCGEEERHNTVNALQDCDVVLSLRIGYQAREKLLKNGVLSFEMYDTVENGLKHAVEKIKEAV